MTLPAGYAASFAVLVALCQMRILSSMRQWQQLVDRFGHDDISKWPEGVDAEAYFLRG